MSVFGTTMFRLEHEQEDFVVEALAEALRPEWIEEALAESGRASIRERLLPARFIVWFVILPGLFRRASYANLLEKLAGTWWTSRRWRRSKPPCTCAVAKARDRLGVEPVRRLFERSAEAWLDESAGLCLGSGRVYALDGTTCKPPDTAENRSYWGKPGASRGTAAYPQLRLVSLMDVGTRLVKAFRDGPYRTGEMTLARELLSAVGKGDVVLLDRDFPAYDFLWDLHAGREADFVVRMKKSMKRRVLRELSAGDAIVEVEIPRHLRRKRPDMPRRWILREVAYRVQGEEEEIRLLRTLLDDYIVPKEALAEGYGRRWEEETSIDEMKMHLCKCSTITEPVLFRSRTPERVEQQLYGLMIAYNAARRTMLKAAVTEGVSPLRVSFTAALERIREAVQDMMRMPTPQLPQRYKLMLEAIGRAKIPIRPNRR